MRKSIVLVMVMSGLVILTACTTALRYEPTAGVAKVKTATRPVAVKSFEDRRPNMEAGSSKIGTAWGGSGAAKLFLPLFVPVSVEMPAVSVDRSDCAELRGARRSGIRRCRSGDRCRSLTMHSL